MSAFDLDTMVAHADRAIAKIDEGGVRGTSMVTYQEIEAMACLIVALRAEIQLIHTHDGETA